MCEKGIQKGSFRPVVLPLHLGILSCALSSPQTPLLLDLPLTIMSDKGEKTCPLCAEEMDLTDQQLKPCKCGYEICVWCWHHIMDMAEKDNTEGRCPACRTPYDKEKIVGMAANCERLVAEISSERKQKLQKPKPKTFEGRKHLSSVRVIQRNLVYVIGLPLSLADEDLLWRTEYFGQYGKVLKVSISRTATGVIQNSSNNSCSVYITYSKEEEAVRCIQSVHNFILDGRPLSIPDCLYLHDFGSQEDSFSKDEIVSAFTRSRVEQIVGATNNLQRPSGNVLPPPVDAYSNVNTSSTEKPAVKNPSNQNTGSQVGGSCPDDSTGRSIPFPVSASWVMRVSTSWPLAASLSGSSGSIKQKSDSFDSPLVLSEVVCTNRSNHDVGNRSTTAEESCEVHTNSKLDPLELTKQYIDTDCRTTVLKKNAEVILDSTPAIITSSYCSPCLPGSGDSGRDIAAPPITSSIDLTKQFCAPGPDKGGNFDLDGKVQSLCSGLSTNNTHNHFDDSYSIPAMPNSLISNHLLIKPLENGLQQDGSMQFREPTTSLALREVTFDDQRLKGSEGICHSPSMSCSPNLLQTSNQSSCRSLQQGELCTQSNYNAEPRMVQTKHDEAAFPFASANPVLSNGFNDNKTSSFAELDGMFDYSDLFSDMEKGKYLGKFDNDVVNGENNVASDMGESNIISNIMSLDLDSWDDPLTLPHSLIKLLSETDGQNRSLKIPSLRKFQTNNQSRFSFARQEDFENQSVPSKYSAPHDFIENKDPCVEECQNIFSSNGFARSANFPSSHPFTSSSEFSVPRTRISTPPGFSVPSREPPPGFSFHDGLHQAINHSSGNHLLQTPSFLEGQFQAPSTGNVGSTEDVEFIDPAILEVGKGIHTTRLSNTGLDMRATLCPQLSPFEHEARLQLLMQQSIAAHQNQKFSDHYRKRFSPPNDPYGIPPMLVDQSQVNNPSPFSQLSAQHFRNAHTSNGHWSGWNEIKHTNDLGISELLANERLGFSNFLSGFDDLKFRMPGSGNLYNRGFGM